MAATLPALPVTSPLTRRLLALGVPITIQSSVHILLGLVDQVMVGQLGESAISAVGIGGQIAGLTGTIAGTATAGVGVLAAQLHGSRNRGGFVRAAANGYWAVLLLAIPATLVLLAASRPLVALLTPGEAAVIEQGSTYLRVVMSGFALTLMGGLSIALLHASGDTRTPMAVAVATVLANTLLNWLLIFGAGPVPAMGVKGAALATLITQSLAALVMTGLVFRRQFRGLFGGFWNSLRPDGNLLRRLLLIGLPITLDGLAWQGATLAYAAILGRLGAVALAAFLISQKMRSLMFLPLIGLAQGAAIAVGQDLGGGRGLRAQTTALRAMRLGLLANAAMALAVALLAPQLAGLFAVSGETFEWAVFTLRVVAILQVFETVNTILPFVLRGGGDARRVFTISTMTFWGVGIPIGGVLALGLGWGLPGLLIGIACEAAIKSALFLARLRGKRWQHRLA